MKTDFSNIKNPYGINPGNEYNDGIGLGVKLIACLMVVGICVAIAIVSQNVPDMSIDGYHVPMY